MFDYDMTIGQETTKMSAGVLSGSAFCFVTLAHFGLSIDEFWDFGNVHHGKIH